VSDSVSTDTIASPSLVDTVLSTIQNMSHAIVDMVSPASSEYIAMMDNNNKSLFSDQSIEVTSTSDQIIASSSDDSLSVKIPDDVIVTIDTTDALYTDSLVLSDVDMSTLSTISTSGVKLTAVEFGSHGQGLLFSKPVEISMEVNKPDGAIVTVDVWHDGDHTPGMLSDDPSAMCTDGRTSHPISQYTVRGGKISFTTCGASIFVASTSTTITDPTVFVTTWDTTKPGTSNSTSISIPIL